MSDTSDDRTEILARLRLEYETTGLGVADLGPDPFDAFDRWFADARQADCTEPNAMVVSTVDAEGWPAGRNMLLKGFDREGFTFFTNFESDKATAIDATGRAALTFSWLELHRQVRIVGTCEKVDAAEADEYFAMRPRGSQLGAWASDQSRTAADRAAIEQRYADLEAEWADRSVTRPPHWGGFRVRPRHIEFWQGRVNRLHDRLHYTRTGESDAWAVDRLYP